MTETKDIRWCKKCIRKVCSNIEIIKAREIEFLKLLGKGQQYADYLFVVKEQEKSDWIPCVVGIDYSIPSTSVHFPTWFDGADFVDGTDEEDTLDDVWRAEDGD